MLRRFALLFVGVLAAVGVGIRVAPALPMSKHWPMAPAKLDAVGVSAAVGVALALIWVLMNGPTFVVGVWRWT
jgi:hypothetical protein